MNRKALTTLTFLSLVALASPACVAPVWDTSVSVAYGPPLEYGYQPLLYNGYVVYYTDIGEPYYWLGSARVWVPTYARGPYLGHWQRYRHVYPTRYKHRGAYYQTRQFHGRGNPPGHAGGPGTNWKNPPGPLGGPGASPVGHTGRHTTATATQLDLSAGQAPTGRTDPDLLEVLVPPQTTGLHLGVTEIATATPRVRLEGLGPTGITGLGLPGALDSPGPPAWARALSRPRRRGSIPRSSWRRAMPWSSGSNCRLPPRAPTPAPSRLPSSGRKGRSTCLEGPAAGRLSPGGTSI